MKRSAIISAVAIVAVTLLVVVGGVAMLRGDSESNEAATETTQPGPPPAATAPAPPAIAAGRPACPAGNIGGVPLPCLGGDDGEGSFAADEIVVASVWAWWCEPCQKELPALAEFADAHPEYTVVGVHLDKNAGNGVMFLNDIGVDLPSFQDADGRFAAVMGLPPVVPVLVVFRGEQQLATIPTPFDNPEDIAEAVAEVV